MKLVALNTLNRGDTFVFGGVRWVVLEHDNHRTLCLTKNVIERQAFDKGKCNDWSYSTSRKYLNGYFLGRVLDKTPHSYNYDIFGRATVDLTSEYGLKDYGDCNDYIFLLSIDQYRRNRDVIPVISDCWWLATPATTLEGGSDREALIVLHNGAVDISDVHADSIGLRPACYLSGIMVDIEEEVDLMTEKYECVKESYKKFEAAVLDLMAAYKAKRVHDGDN